MCFVGARIRDGGGTKSDAQIGLWYHVRRISQETLFKTTTRVEAIQATILITGWNEYGWLLAGHAVRLAFELGCHTAFLRLARSGMGAGKAPKQIEEERGLVIMARVWFCLVSFCSNQSTAFHALLRIFLMLTSARFYICRSM